MKIKKMAILKLILVGLVSFSIAGCGDENMLESLADKDSDAAKREEIRIAMDNENYELAIEALEAQYAANPDDNEIALELANAYMGNAGFSMLDLIETSDDAAAGGTGDDFTAVSAILPEQTDENMLDMTRAVDLLSSIDPAERTPDQNLQLAIASLSSVVLAVGTANDVNFDEETGDALNPDGTVAIRDQDAIELALDAPVSSIGFTNATTLIGGTDIIPPTEIYLDSTITDLINANIATSIDAIAGASLELDEDGTPADIDQQITDLQLDLGGEFANSSSIAAYLNVNEIL